MRRIEIAIEASAVSLPTMTSLPAVLRGLAHYLVKCP
jgi:hypothetical protein